MKVPYKFVPKGWGYEKWFCNNEKFCGKLLFLAAGKKLSIHFHKLKWEFFYIHKGKVIIYHGNEKDSLTKEILKQGDVFEVPIGLIHRLEAIEDSEVFEFSTQHFDEDSIRIEKGD